MILWCIFAVMTAAAVLAVLWPLGRRRQKVGGGSDVAVYKDQLEEIDRDRATGLIGDVEAEAARLEVSRRLLAAAEKQRPTESIVATQRGLRLRRVAAVAVLLILPFGAPALYLALGSPNIAGEPAFARVKTPQGGESIASLVSQVEAHLAQDPNDATGWELIAPVYLKLGRFDDAVAARKKVLALGGETAKRRADLGEAEVAAANGVVTAEAKATFERARALDPHEAKAGYFLGLAAEQDGNADAAGSIWRTLLAEAPPNAPWAGFVRAALARLGQTTTVPGPSANDVAAAAKMTDDQRNDMIRGMVAGLESRLHDNGADVDGWLRLVRAYAVLGDRDKARNAAAEARRALADHPEEIKRVDDLVKGLGIES
ncbi:MAG: c-type cytochrome biogenesis protein CcmI [Hyphomicrobiales bacterium]|nr:c-type cytochrome biogenesis protein CcmI [Hyphomicrobiales bacterium]MDE1974125.1 c-type cytochrome biogenesis protein CcmI [Hyphomicrobiales bacterium]MDE2283821.1 c-type cytochrome biogenesis protein CcmI [Hyphomicrobiales bacterium]